MGALSRGGTEVEDGWGEGVGEGGEQRSERRSEGGRREGRGLVRWAGMNDS